MTVPLLLEHFDELISTPDDVERLNRSILQLAMQGKLVKQNPNDKPVSELLKRIQSSNPDTEEPTPINQDEIPFSAPSGWAWVHIPEVTYNWGQKKPDEQFTYIDVSSIDNQHGKLVDDLAIVEAKDAPSRARKVVKKGCVIYSTVRPYLLNIAIIDRDIQPEPIVSTAFYVMQPVEGLDAGFLYLYLRSEYFTKFVESQMKGMAYPAISDGKMAEGIIPLPPLAEQQRIVARVEELFAQTRLLAEQLSHSRTELDRLNESALAHLLASETPEEFNERWCFIVEHFDLLTSAPEHIAPLRQSILELAVRGKLTRREAGDESAKELLAKVGEEKTKLGKDKSLSPVKDNEKPFEIPNNWEWTRLQDLTETITKGSSPNWQGVQYVNKGEGVLFITSKNVGQFSLVTDEETYVEEKFNKIEPRSILKKGDILMNIVGASIGRSAIFNLDTVANINQAVCLIRLANHDLLNKDFFILFFNSSTCIGYMFDKQVDNARANLSMGNIANFAIPVPPLAEQERIVKRVEQLLGWCDALEAQLANAERERGRLVESVLAKVGG